MRAIVFEEPYSITIRVEGDLTAEATRELSSHVAQWREMTAEKKMRLDLGDVGAVDAHGAAWLRDASRSGVGFTAMSPAVQRAASNCADAAEHISWFRRLLCAFLPPGTAGCPCER